jgi:hypothetical protein
LCINEKSTEERKKNEKDLDLKRELSIILNKLKKENMFNNSARSLLFM